DALAPGRNTGIQANGNLFDKRMYWAVGGFRDVEDGGSGFGKGEKYQVTARLTGLPIYAEESRRMVHLGAAYSHQFANEDTAFRIRQRPEAHLASFWVDTGNFTGVDDVDKFGSEVAVVFGPVSVQGEYMAARYDIDSPRSEEALLWGGYVFASWFIT